jgi:hypothetical protein
LGRFGRETQVCDQFMPIVKSLITRLSRFGPKRNGIFVVRHFFKMDDRVAIAHADVSEGRSATSSPQVLVSVRYRLRDR